MELRTMHALLRQSFRLLMAITLAGVLAVPQNLAAQAHVVSPQDLQKKALEQSQSREQNLETVNKFLSSPTASEAMKIAGADPQQVKTAVSNLSDQELAQLASRAQKAQADFAAGNITDHDLLVILIAIVALVLIIVAVHH